MDRLDDLAAGRQPRDAAADRVGRPDVALGVEAQPSGANAQLAERRLEGRRRSARARSEPTRARSVSEPSSAIVNRV